MRLRSTETAIDDAMAGLRPVGGEGRTPIGLILVGKGVLSENQFEAVIARQEQTGELFGEAAKALHLIDDEQLQRALEAQHRFPVLAEGDARVDPRVVSAFQPDDPFAHAIRSLRGSLPLAGPDRAGEGLRRLVLLGIGAPAEAMLIAANLAVSCAQAGYRTLIADANVASPAQHVLFRLPNRKGLTSLLSRAEEAQAVVQRTALPLLSMMPAGPAVPNASELFARIDLFDALAPLSHQHDLMLIDASRSEQTDLSIWSGADGVLLAVRQDETMLRDVDEQVRRLRAHAVPIVGTVMAT